MIAKPRVVMDYPESISKILIIATPPGGASKDITFVRGVPTTLTEYSFTDPFGPERLGLQFDFGGVFVRPGRGELDWLVPGCDIDLRLGGNLPFDERWSWEGRPVSVSMTSDPVQITVDVQGAMHEMDDYVAPPLYSTRPIPYELAIMRQFDRVGTRLANARIEWPDWWTTTYTSDEQAANYLIPEGVTPGHKWSGLVTRNTGHWDQVLTGYIQELLSTMYTERGQWTVMLDQGRVPVLRHRDLQLKDDHFTLVVDCAAPGVSVQLDEDWMQSLSVIYASGRSLSGSVWSGMGVSGDGRRTSYVPAAHLRQAWPRDDDNPWFDPTYMHRETHIEAGDGLERAQGEKLAREHLKRFANPGWVGTVTLTTDPVTNFGQFVFPRMLIRPGKTLRLAGLLGEPQGVLVHVSHVSVNPQEKSTTLTVDTRFRDFLTVDQVRNRGRDSLNIMRTLAVGKYQPVVPDMLYPWSYDESGFIPGQDGHNAKVVLEGIPDDVLFPWESWTVMHPPSNPAYSAHYISIGPASTDATKNWSGTSRSDGAKFAYGIRMSQQGSSRLIQIAAYDETGHVMAVPFHVSFYQMPGTNVQAMPILPADEEANNPPYKSPQRYPFFRAAFEQYENDGTIAHPETPNPVSTAGLLAGFGNDGGKAGFWPGIDDGTYQPTGLLVVEGSDLAWDSTRQSGWDPRATDGGTGGNALLGSIYVMIYCDAQATKKVYFLGRIFRDEPGVS